MIFVLGMGFNIFSHREGVIPLCPFIFSHFFCGRRPAGLLVTLVVVVVIIVVVGGIIFIHGQWKSPCMVIKQIKSKTPYFYYLFIYFKSPCMILMPMYGQDKGVGSHPILKS